jgi:hypothetical protein
VYFLFRPRVQEEEPEKIGDMKSPGRKNSAMVSGELISANRPRIIQSKQ